MMSAQKGEYILRTEGGGGQKIKKIDVICGSPLALKGSRVLIIDK